uniref:Calponin-homology (CH) domain-containing protein n=1 Tax=Hofstenia miamia TaxID=442651 RepID=A0A2D3E4T2_HOFMI|nr:hypothetical protein hm.98018390 [Hofstenia miamia]
MSTREVGYGLTAELKQKMAEKYSLEEEQMARQWIEAILKRPLNPDVPPEEPLGPDRLHEVLKDGLVLCDMMNNLKPGSCRHRPSKIAFKQMENIGMFLTASEAYGVKRQDSFQTADLFDNTNMNAVVQTIHALGRQAKKQNYQGPLMSVPSESTENVRFFTEEQLREGESILPLQSGTDKFQDTSSWGRPRQIVHEVKDKST